VILLTGARKNEIRTLRWEYVDLNPQAPMLRIPDSKTGFISIALGKEALALLKEIPRHHGFESDWVFTGMRPDKPTQNIDAAWYSIRERAGLSDLHLHDLRHLFGTTAGALNFQGPKIQAALNHKTPSMTSRYVNLKDASKLEVARAVGTMLSMQRKRKE
jgi:integrase